LRRGVWIAVLVAAAGAAVASTFSQPAAARRLDTAFVDPRSFATDATSIDRFGLARSAGARSARLLLNWSSVAPARTALTKPPDFTAADPSDPLYNWTRFDEQLRNASAAGIEPIVYIYGAPAWAENNGQPSAPRPTSGTGNWKPSPTEFRAFAQAAAQRYSGTFGCEETCLPRVRYWQAWNEPNRVYFLYPQKTAPRWYRAMVNQFAAGVHSVPGNVVVAGGLSPYGKRTGLAPMRFMRSMLCMSTKPYHAVCSRKSTFDTWTHHPYTCGGPNREAFSSQDIGVADLPEMRALLKAAIRSNRVRHSRPVGFWATELGWISKPPRGDGVPLRLHARWVAEALYRSWRAHVSLVTWFPLVDVPRSIGPYQSGLYFANGVDAKTRSVLAFRFPFVAYVRSAQVYVWGRIPPNSAGQYVAQTVAIQRRTSSGWRTVGRVRSSSTGLFAKTLRIRTRGTLRAVGTVDGTRVGSNPFGLKRPRDPYICAFGN
jgi:hypothetical protein